MAFVMLNFGFGFDLEINCITLEDILVNVLFRSFLHRLAWNFEI